MAQETQTPTGRKKILRADGSIVDEFGNVIQEAATVPAPAPLGQISLGRPGGDDGAVRDLGDVDPRDLVAGGIKAATAATGFLPGFKLPMAALRIALGAGGDALAAEVKGEDPLDAAMRGGALSAAGEGLGAAVPEVTSRAAVAAGASLKHLKEPGKYAGAFNREAGRRKIPILVGERGRVGVSLKRAGENLERIETNTPGDVGLRQLQGANAELSQSQRNTMDTFGRRNTIDNADQLFIESQALDRNGLTPQDFDTMAVQVHARFAQIFRQAGVPLNQLPSVGAFRHYMMERLIDATRLDARALGELKRGIRAPGDDVIKARQAGAFVPASEQLSGQIHANNADRVNDLYKSLDQDTRGMVEKITDLSFGDLINLIKGKGMPVRGDLARANQRFGDLSLMSEASNAVRRDPSYLGVRGALGGTVGAGIFGIPWELGTALGIAATPENISGLGFLLQRLAQTAPIAVRGHEASQDIQEGVRRRKP